jgi:hypothetical protein
MREMMVAITDETTMGPNASWSSASVRHRTVSATPGRYRRGAAGSAARA